MQELEKDYQAGHISKEKYNYLSREYQNRLTTMNATNNVRNMQGRKKPNHQKKPSQRSMAEASKREDKDLVDKYVVRSKKDKKKKPPIQNKGKYAIVAVVFLIIAFIGGISFGLFNDFQQTSPVNLVATINDTAFPEVESNVTINDTSTNTDDSTIDDTSTQNTSSNTNNDQDSDSSDSDSDSGDDSNTDSGTDSGTDSSTNTDP